MMKTIREMGLLVLLTASMQVLFGSYGDWKNDG